MTVIKLPKAQRSGVPDGSTSEILWPRSQLLFPFQNTCPARRSLCLGNLTCPLQSDGEAGVGERIVGS